MNTEIDKPVEPTQAEAAEPTEVATTPENGYIAPPAETLEPVILPPAKTTPRVERATRTAQR